MNYPCDTVLDLLPLYHDDVCSASSRRIVDEHLLECDSCKNALARIDDSTYDSFLRHEKEDVVGTYTRSIKRKSLLAGICIASLLAVPILVCLIVNIVSDHALDWFFIVLTALLVLASVTVVPLVAEKHKGLWTLGGFTASLAALLLACCLYSGGTWFFVVLVPILFGLSVLFAPFVLYQLPLKGFAARNKGLIALLADTALLFATIIVSRLSFYPSTDWATVFLVAATSLLLPWALFVIIRYARASGFSKAGLCFIVGALFFSGIDSAIS
ncbi:MAG: zf-HC2 domain-containing protein, partial [Coriobacteriales bacterium]|nr:zf-HC2 domain-containing protein [Coriobacteriales bacterium]